MRIAADRTVRLALLWAFVALAVLAAIVGLVRRDRLPATVHVATGDPHGLYHQLWQAVKPKLEERLGRPVTLHSTTGSVANRQMLQSGEVQIAMMQGDQLLTGSLDDGRRLSIVAPLYPEPTLVIACRDGADKKIESVRDLNGQTVYLGPRDSGSHASAMRLFEHFHVKVSEPPDDRDPQGFLGPLEKGEADAAVVVTGLQNPDVVRLLDSGRFDLVSIPEAQGYAGRSVQWQPYAIPEGYFSGSPTTPASTIQTLATAGLVVVPADTSPKLVQALLEVFYERGLQTEFANLLPRSQALAWCPVEPHSSARGYFDPVDRLGEIAAMMESIAATKELLFALGAGLFLLWQRAQAQERRRRKEALQQEKDRLDAMLQQTLDIEVAQMRTTDPEQLRGMLDEVTTIKLRALRELTEEELYADEAFSIFLMQCSNLISKIQLKIISLTTPGADLASADTSA